MEAESYDMVIRYAENEMSAEERLLFEERLSKEEPLRNALEEYKEVTATLKLKLTPDLEADAFRATLKDMNQEFFQPKTKIISIKKRAVLWAVAASVAAIVLVTQITWRSSLYDKYAIAQMTVITERGNQADSLLQQATTLFNKEKFQESLPYFQQLANLKPGDSYVNLFYGVALQQTGQTAASRNILEPIFNGQSLLRFDAAFYIALSYLKEKNNDLCLQWLGKIPADSPLHEKVLQLMERLQ